MLKISPWKAASGCIGCKKIPWHRHCSPSIRASPGRPRDPGPNLPSPHCSPPGTLQIPFDSPPQKKPLIPGNRIPATEGSHGKNQMRFQRALRRDWKAKFYGRGARPHAFHLVPSANANPAAPASGSSTANTASLPSAGSRWVPGRRFSSGLGAQQPHAAATNPTSA